MKKNLNSRKSLQNLLRWYLETSENRNKFNLQKHCEFEIAWSFGLNVINCRPLRNKRLSGLTSQCTICTTSWRYLCGSIRQVEEWPFTMGWMMINDYISSTNMGTFWTRNSQIFQLPETLLWFTVWHLWICKVAPTWWSRWMLHSDSWFFASQRLWGKTSASLSL